jgi:hypothetical protein
MVHYIQRVGMNRKSQGMLIQLEIHKRNPNVSYHILNFERALTWPAIASCQSLLADKSCKGNHKAHIKSRPSWEILMA